MKFREEFIRARRQDSLGTVSLSFRKGVAIAAIAFLVGSALVILAICFVSYSHYETVSGYVAEQQSKSAISSPLPASFVVSELFLKEGDKLTPGKAIASVIFESDVSGGAFSASANSFYFIPDRSVRDGKRLAIISSTISGMVENLLVREGGSISPMQPIMTASTSPQHIYFQMLVPGAVVSSFAVGSPLLVTVSDVQDHQYSHVSGVVKRISRSAMSPMEVSAFFGMPPPPSQRYIVEVGLKRPLSEAQIKAIRPGMNAVVSIKTKERTLVSWLFQK